MGIKARFMHKQTRAAQVDKQSTEKLEPLTETVVHKRSDDDTASTKSCSSDISKVKEQPEQDQEPIEVTNAGFLSTLCCHGGSLPGDDDDDLKEIEDAPKQKAAGVEEGEGFFAKITGTFLYIIGQAPPVEFVKCLEDRSVDQSEVSLPQVLTDMAEEYDQTQLKLQIQDDQLKEQYEKQEKSRRKLKLPSMKRNSGHSSTSATVCSNGSFFERLKKKSATRKKKLSPMYEI